MKRISIVFLVLLSLTACNKDDGEDVVDCFMQSLLVNVHHTKESDKSISFNVTYSGEYALKNSIVWDYGDGKVETVAGTTTSHVYSKPGSYKVNASVSLVSPSCTFEVKEDVTVE